MVGIRPKSKTYGVWNPVPDSMKKEVVKCYLGGMSSPQIERKFFISNSTVLRFVEEAGHKTRTRKYKTGKIEKKIVSYYLSNHTAPETAKKFGIGSSRVYKILENFGVTKRYSAKGRGKKTRYIENKIIKLYLKSQSPVLAARKFAINETTVYAVLDRNNIKRFGKGIRGERHHNWSNGLSSNPKEYRKHRKETDEIYKLKVRLRNRIWAFFNKSITAKKLEIKKSYKSQELLGGSWQTIKSHIESKFRDGMSWGNYGKIWQINHALPLASAKAQEDLIRLFHYKNLQPLLVSENRKKSDKMPDGTCCRINLRRAA